MEIFHRAGTALVKGHNSMGKEENNDGNNPLRCGAPFFLAAMYLREFRHAIEAVIRRFRPKSPSRA